MLLAIIIIFFIITAIIIAACEYWRYRMRKRHAEIWAETTSIYLGYLEALNEECNAEIDISEMMPEIREILKPDKEISPWENK